MGIPLELTPACTPSNAVVYFKMHPYVEPVLQNGAGTRIYHGSTGYTGSGSGSQGFRCH